MSWLGRNVLGSSKLPARIVTISGAEPGSPNRGDPQSPQNARVVACPLSAVSSKYFGLDRKSTRLNSSHRTISYAVFCLKKKKKKRTNQIERRNKNEKRRTQA